MVVDVRRFPGSRRYPHFNKASTIKLLNDEKIEYVHIEKLGGRQEKTDLARNGNSHWQNKSRPQKPLSYGDTYLAFAKTLNGME